MGTDELYRVAGWMTPHPPAETSRSAAAAAARQSLRLEPHLALVEKLFKPRSECMGEGTGESRGESEARSEARGEASGEEREGVAVEEEELLGADSEDEGLSEGVPRSMADIYKISNRNRRRNKEKKKQREGPITGTEAGSEPSETSPSFDYFGGRTKRPKEEAEEGVEPTVNFLVEMGWVDPARAAALGHHAANIGHFADFAEAAANPYLAHSSS